MANHFYLSKLLCNVEFFAITGRQTQRAIDESAQSFFRVTVDFLVEIFDNHVKVMENFGLQNTNRMFP